MASPAEVEPDPLAQEAPAVWAALSRIGRAMRQPATFLPLQTAEARGKGWNATIGQITDGHGRAVPLPTMAAAVAGLDEAERTAAFLYSPVDGLPALRLRWRERQRRGVADTIPSSLPLVTVGLGEARALAAELFVDPGQAVVLPDTALPDVRDLFTLRLEARIHPVPLVRDGVCEPDALGAALAALPDGEPAFVLFDGRWAEAAEKGGEAARAALVRALADAAARRSVVVLVEEGDGEGAAGPSRPLFWDLVGRRENLLPLLIESADAVFGHPGGGVAFLTFPFPPESEVAGSLSGRARMLHRAIAGSPVALAQVLLLRLLKPGAPSAA
jgi:Aminotransferase class I and II